MGNLVADIVELHSSFPFIAALLENQRQAAPEAQARESAVIRIVEGPGPPTPPVLMRLTDPDGIPASLLNVRLQLSPSEDEVRLVIDPLLLVCGSRCRFFAGFVLRVAQALEVVVDLFKYGCNGPKIPQRRIRLNHSRVTASRSHRCLERTASQFGRAKFSAVSTRK